MRWRGGAVDRLVRHPDGAAALDELTAALRNARHAIDAPARRLYAGRCTALVPDEDGLAAECGTDLLAAPGSAVVECRACGTPWPLAERRSWLLERAEDMLLPAAEIARAADGLGLRLSVDTLRSWVRRRQLVGRGRVPLSDGRTAEPYRVGDVLDFVHAAAARRGRGRRSAAA